MQKAKISDDKGKSVAFQFNPETVSFTKAAEWSETPSKSSADAPIRQFIGTKPLELSLKMVLDDTEGKADSVATRINQLLSWTNPGDDSDKPEPHQLKFEWGTLQIGLNKLFNCHCESVSVEYTLFKEDGTPLRAIATVKLKGLPTRSYGQNPTSGAIQPVKSHLLMRGDEIPVITQREYGATRRWREVADHNQIDNPFRLPLGRELVLPKRSALDDAHAGRRRNA